MDSGKYSEHLQIKDRDFESICTRCGDCCGANDDPCRNLVRLERDKYYCKNYDKRFGSQKTISGKAFSCVSIREHIAKGTLRPGCAYRSVK